MERFHCYILKNLLESEANIYRKITNGLKVVNFKLKAGRFEDTKISFRNQLTFSKVAPKMPIHFILDIQIETYFDKFNEIIARDKQEKSPL